MIRNVKNIIVPLLLVVTIIAGHNTGSAQQKGMMIRISEIVIHPEFLDEYKRILTEESSDSIRLEPGVVAIFPMFEKEHPTEIRILEIYATREAYESHLKTPHFQKYKTTTLNMVKSLKLVDMTEIDPETMTKIFKKLKR